MHPTLEVALLDAVKNCEENEATARFGLRGGVILVGKIVGHDPNMVHVETDDGGWMTILKDEIVAIGASA